MINKRVYAIVILSVMVLSGCVGQEKENPISISVENLFENPEMYKGEFVSVTGYIEPKIVDRRWAESDIITTRLHISDSINSSFMMYMFYTFDTGSSLYESWIDQLMPEPATISAVVTQRGGVWLLMGPRP